MTRKYIAILLCAVLLCGMLCSCGANQSSAENTSQDPANTVSQQDTGENASAQTGAAADSSLSGSDASEVADSTSGGENAETNSGTNDPTQAVSYPTAPEGVDDATIPDLPEDVTAPAAEEVTYEDYQAMSGEEQMVFMDSFDSMEAFFAWYNAALEEYKSKMVETDGSTPIDLGELLEGNG